MNRIKTLLTAAILALAFAIAGGIPAYTAYNAPVGCSQLPALTGDTTTSAASCATTTAKIGGKSVTLGANFTTTGTGAPTLAFSSTGRTFTFPDATDTLAALGTIQTFSAAQTFGSGGTPASNYVMTINGSAAVSQGADITFQRNGTTTGIVGDQAAILGSATANLTLFSNTGLGINFFVNGGAGTNSLSLTSGGLVELPQIGSDATHTDATVCEDTTSHALYAGSGAAGICLGTSSIRFKHAIEPLRAGLPQIMALEPVSYHLNADHGDPSKKLYGFTAEQGGKALPDLVGLDTNGRPNTFDYMGVVPVLVKAIQEQQAEIDALKRGGASVDSCRLRVMGACWL